MIGACECGKDCFLKDFVPVFENMVYVNFASVLDDGYEAERTSEKMLMNLSVLRWACQSLLKFSLWMMLWNQSEH